MTVKEIVKEYLEKNGYDGLCRDGCGCGLEVFVKNGELNDIVYSTEKGK